MLGWTFIFLCICMYDGAVTFWLGRKRDFVRRWCGRGASYRELMRWAAPACLVLLVCKWSNSGGGQVFTRFAWTLGIG
ncbi:hypothetical protein IQ07DRAFT_587348 [Pyrenochaeta sp. DS3sAY3a]|nr:hypothetical protein IQ07DRAFT_587348 [Pyrenochaeta sp. DS3sAY3a]